MTVYHLKRNARAPPPVAFARVGPRMSLIDAGGTLMELTPKHKYSFPVILGMNPGEPLSTRAPRMKAYAEMVRELDAGGARYSQDLSEVDLSDLEDVKVRVNDAAGDVLVHLGSSDYLRRYKIYVTHAQGWRQQFQKLVPRGTAVRDVRCFPPQTPRGGGRGDCTITMIDNKPDPGYTYRVIASRTRFVAQAVSANLSDAWTPPGLFSGGY